MSSRRLVVDDDAAIRILVSRVLSRNDYEVDVARDGAEAIEMMLAHDYCVIVLDLMMPRIDGFTVIRYLSEYHPEQLRNVIVMTAFGTKAAARVSPPVERIIEKPFDIGVLISEITAHRAALEKAG